MPDAANKAKTKWNSAHYRQVKVSVDPAIAAAFQAACVKTGCSMASVLSAYMAEYGKTAIQTRPSPGALFNTKKKRRKALAELIQQLNHIKDAQEHSKDNIPESLKGADAYYSAEESIALMDEAILLLESIY